MINAADCNSVIRRFESYHVLHLRKIVCLARFLYNKIWSRGRIGWMHLPLKQDYEVSNTSGATNILVLSFSWLGCRPVTAEIRGSESHQHRINFGMYLLSLIRSRKSKWLHASSIPAIPTVME